MTVFLSTLLLCAALAGAADVQYVQASTLNLRAAPSPAAKVLGKLTIGSPLTLMEASGAFVHVRVFNGREGWVDQRFLARAPLTLAQAQAGAAAATTPAERVSWA